MNYPIIILPICVSIWLGLWWWLIASHYKLMRRTQFLEMKLIDLEFKLRMNEFELDECKREATS